jgi:two-component system invasion response regulator UvrY
MKFEKLVTSILIVDDHPMTCFGIELLVKKAISDCIIYTAHSFTEALEVVQLRKPDLVMLDLGIPGGLGVEMIKALREIKPDVKILICSGRDELTNAPQYLQFGANGFMNKNTPENEAKRAIKMVMENKNYLSERIQVVVMDNLINNTKPFVNPMDLLTPREKEVLALLMQGKWVKEVANELNLKFSTVSTQKAKIFQKMNVDNMVDLVRKVEMLTNS